MSKRDDINWNPESNKTEDRLAFIYNKYYDDIYRTIFYIVNDTVTTKDLISDLFYKLWKNIDKLDKVKNLKSYLSVSARNMALSQVARQKTERILVPIDLHHNALSDANTPLDVMVNNELSNILTNIIEELPSKRKLIFKECRIEGKSYREIAKQYNLSTKTIEDHMRKAMQFLKQRLKDLTPIAITTLLTLSVYSF